MARGKKNNDDLPKAKITKSTLSKSAQIFSYNKENLWKFYIGIIFLLLTSATALIFPKYMGELADTAKEHNIERANELGFLLVLVLIGQSVFSYFRIYLFVNFTEHTLAKLRVKTYEHLITLPMTYFSEKRVGELNSRLSADVNQIQDTLTTTIAEFARQIILIVGGIALLAVYSMKLTLLMLSIVPIIAIAGVVLGRLIRKISKEVQDKVAESNTVVEETLQGIANVKSFANELYEIIRYQKSIDEIVKLATRNGMYRGGFASFIIFCVFGAIVAVVWYGVILTIQGELTIGSLLAFVLYSVFVGAAIGGTAELYAQIQKSVGAAERIFEILGEKVEDIELNARKNLQKLNGELIFDKVAFTYPSRKEIQVLKEISFHAGKGETIAIVGPSGAGKTTIASLMLRFYTPEKGTILIDGIDYTSYQLSHLRNNIAIVPQDVLLFGGSIKENIAYGNPDATFEEIMAAAQKANALSFIESFPEKFDTIVGERGIKLSGGQRQRIAIARAVLKNPAILILDEATSSLDSESERLVQEALDNLMVGRTSIVIAHRLSTIRKADKIVVMDKGVVKELGTHDELIGIENGLYKNLSRLQFDIA